MLSTIESINSVINNFIWGLPAMICIIGVGIVLSVKTRFIQIRKFPYAMKITIGRMLKKRKASDGALTPFQAVCTALAATVGTGNIAGVAGAIAIEVQGLYSGCGYPQYLECVLNFPRWFLLYISEKLIIWVSLLDIRCTILKWS